MIIAYALDRVVVGYDGESGDALVEVGALVAASFLGEDVLGHSG